MQVYVYDLWLSMYIPVQLSGSPVKKAGGKLGHHARDFFRLHIDMDNLSLSR